jgi:uncharacterized protein YukE
MKTDVDNIKSNVDKITRRYSELIQKKVELDSMWDGSASETFKKAVDDDIVALMTMMRNLEKIYNYENAAKDSYKSCEQQISGVISDI